MHGLDIKEKAADFLDEQLNPRSKESRFKMAQFV